MRKNNTGLAKKIISNEYHILYKIIIVLFVYVVISCIMILQDFNVAVKIKLNDVITKDIIVEEDTKYIDEEASARNEGILRITTPPYYIFNKQYSDERCSSFLGIVSDIRKGISYSKIIEIYEKKDISLNESEINLFAQILNAYPRDIDKIYNIIKGIYTRGVIKLDGVILSKIEVSGLRIVNINEKNTSDILYSAEEVMELELSHSDVKRITKSNFNYYSDIEQKLLANFLISFIQPNIIYDNERSDVLLKSKLKNERNRYGKIHKGQIVARKGDVVTEDNISQIKAVLHHKQNSISYKTVASYLMINIFILVFFFFIMNLYDPGFFQDVRNLFFIAMIFVIYIIYMTLPINFDRSSYYFGVMIPVSTFSITFIFLYSRITSVFVTIAFAIAFFFFSDYNSSSFLFILLSGICSIFTIKSNVRKRVDLLVAGFFIAIINIVIVAVISYFDGLYMLEIFNYSIYAGVNGIVSSVFAIGLISLGEFVLNTPTVFRLQELSDTSSPLIKELFDNAVGTYTHSINVANLAEAAANEIKANGLLARVGGLYHDIGKVGNAEYFIENQGEYNIHAELKPSISATIIKSHIKRGVDKAKNAHLPQNVIDIISQHHGNSLIKYFYNEALKQRTSEDEEVQKEIYQYKADNPKFPEAAIVMLADQVEAVSRVISKATFENFENMVNKIVDEKFTEGILDDSGLTLKDLTKIKKIFVKTLLGMYHSRIEYPDPVKTAGKNNG